MSRPHQISNCEQEFILRAIKDGKRLDGRHIHDHTYRKIDIDFGNERGLCVVNLGRTSVMAHVSCEVIVPRASRPNEGMLFLNVELSPMAAPNFESGRLSEFGVEINRILERCLKESRAIDVESLCIVGGEKAWAVRVNITVLNHDGNLVDCVSIAAIAALAHFRRPDVTISGEDVTINTLEEKNPVPLSIHHWPVCVTFAFYDQGQYFIVDPTEREERVMDGKTVLGMNIHREICTLHLSGNVSLKKQQILRCANIAATIAADVVQLIKSALATDNERRSNSSVSLSDSIQRNLINASCEDTIVIPIAGARHKSIVISRDSAKREQEAEDKVAIKGLGTAAIVGESGVNTWTVSDDDMDEEEADIIEIMHKVAPSKDMEEQMDSDNSEEDQVHILEQTDLK